VRTLSRARRRGVGTRAKARRRQGAAGELLNAHVTSRRTRAWTAKPLARTRVGSTRALGVTARGLDARFGRGARILLSALTTRR